MILASALNTNQHSLILNLSMIFCKLEQSSLVPFLLPIPVNEGIKMIQYLTIWLDVLIRIQNNIFYYYKYYYFKS